MWQPGQSLADVEKEVILKALRFYQGNKAQTARSLGIAPNTLASKLDQYQGKEEKHGNNLHPSAGIPVQPTPAVATEPSVSVRKPKKV